MKPETKSKLASDIGRIRPNPANARSHGFGGVDSSSHGSPGDNRPHHAVHKQEASVLTRVTRET